MQNYHNGVIDYNQARGLAEVVHEMLQVHPTLCLGQYSQMVHELLAHPYYERFNRNGLEVFLEKNEARFIADNERIEPSGTGI